LTFTNNDGDVGEDIFIRCVDLTLFVNSSSFSFAPTTDGSRYSLVGTDSVYFKDEEEDLYLFIVAYSGSSVYLNGENEDEIFWGMINYPCKSVEYGFG
jgi:hypothetical protein